jgi:ketosteroid isomerase-like protein
MGESEHSSRLEAAQAFVMHLGHRDFERCMALLSETVTYKVPGYGPLAGGLVGHDAVAGHLADLVARTGGSYDSLKWVDWMVGEDHVAVLAEIHMQGSGQRYVGPVLFLLSFDGGDKITGIVVFLEDVASVTHVLGG